MIQTVGCDCREILWSRTSLKAEGDFFRPQQVNGMIANGSPWKNSMDIGRQPTRLVSH